MKHRKIKQLLLILLFVCLHNISSANQAELIGSVECKFQGCFGGGQSKITLYRKAGNVVAYYIDKKDNLSSATLTPEQVKSFYQFIKELKEKKFLFGCTTTESYSVRIKNEIIDKTDGSCDWHGFDKLTKKLFGPK